MTPREPSAADRIRDAIERFNREETNALDPGLVSEDVRLDRPGGLPGMSGRRAFLEWLRPDAFENQRVEVHEIDEVADDLVLVRQTFHGTGAGSGIEMTQDGFTLWYLREDQIVRMSVFFDEADARAAIEETTS